MGLFGYKINFEFEYHLDYYNEYHYFLLMRIGELILFNIGNHFLNVRYSK